MFFKIGIVKNFVNLKTLFFTEHLQWLLLGNMCQYHVNQSQLYLQSLTAVIKFFIHAHA